MLNKSSYRKNTIQEIYFLILIWWINFCIFFLYSEDSSIKYEIKMSYKQFMAI